jgi:hypothetical protein
MSRRRRKPKETHLLIEHPPQQRGKRETSRLLDLLDRIASGKPNKEEANR